ncbi:MAG: lipolytic protein G-D-S-L family [Oscillatoriales cyanobacterium]|uniref:SGNH/GDSL hydrolase family protein n=1 Tax=Microcoleus anatoxicus PTRS2 TaxID=2705321 RepID=A0ABU8YGR1_9CYAN|nr:MAG: lipolytic protein G-D-S-L family [Oscillatoriales cyanobacterium]TAD96300.1 MAG: lipolytic protein G-D-S-L family [Oscillatoriales cyanobacterium]TAE04736.1 MAG: lipolytic protein G-D-S-L family [Oscillatoriales cyanobacterium]
MSPKVRSPRPKYPLKQIVIRFATAVIAALIFINIPHSLIPMFPESPSIASLPPEIENILAGQGRIVTIGDSITEAGKYPGGYVWLLQRYLNGLYPDRAIEIINVGISGNKATDMQARFQQDVIDKKPDLVMINVGVNDVWHAFFDFQNHQFHPQGNLTTGVALAEYQQKLTQMVEAAKAAGIRVALLSPTPIREVLDGPENQRLQEYIIAMREIALQNQCLFIDLNKPFREVIGTFQRHAGKTLNLLAADGVHPNPSGYRIMAFSILRGLGIPTKDIENWEIKN